MGPYEVLRRLGGEFSAVAEGRAGAAPETYALKVIGKAKVPAAVLGRQVDSNIGAREPRGERPCARRTTRGSVGCST